MQSKQKDQNPKIQKHNYQQKNQEYIQKLKEKKLKEIQEKAIQQKKQLLRKENLKKKILEQAKNAKQNKKIDNQDQQYLQLTQNQDSKKIKARGYAQSLPKIVMKDGQQQTDNKNYQDKYMSFLQNLHKNIKSKKQIEQQQKKRKQQKYAKIKQQLGFNKVSSKITYFRVKDQSVVRSQSAQKFTQEVNQESQLPKTNKNFKRKNQEYLEKIKKKRQDQERLKQQQKLKKQKMKEKLKDFVMITVKKNVMDGVYDGQLDKKRGKNKNKDGQSQKSDDQDDEENQQSQSDQQQQIPQKKKKRKMRSFPYVTDLKQWRKKNRLQNQQKVFIVTGGYGQLKKALRQRGWVQNPDYNSPCFNLKYTLQGKQIDHDKLFDFQMTNHFLKNSCITTKVGLTKSLRNLIWINDTSQDNFYPKCFDLNDQDDNVGFQIHFKLCKALSILKIYDNFKKNNQKKKQQDKKGVQDLKLRTQIALSVCQKNIQQLDQIIDKKKTLKIVTDKQWQILAQDQLNQQSLAKKKHQQWLKSIDIKYNNIGNNNTMKKKQKKQQKKKKKNQKIKNQIKQQQKDKQQYQQQDQQIDQLYQQVKQILIIYQKKYPQYHLTHHNNIWILKPAGLSRGRGITCYNNLVQIQDHIKCKQSQWIAQKYIENPLVILKRKFDIRQWVLVTDFNPLTIWLYDQCYIRFSASDYDAKQLSNKFIHLTNNSIGAYHKKFDQSHIKGNMFFKSQFSQYLQKIQSYDVFEQVVYFNIQKIKPQIKQIVKLSLMCGAQGIQNRKNNHQLFGYDFMVDTNYKVWLIQINSSPSMDYSTHVTTKLVKQCLRDIAKVIVDYAQAPKKQRKNIDTGGFKKIYKGIQIPEKPISTGLNLCLEGIALKKPKKNFVKVQNFSLQKN